MRLADLRLINRVDDEMSKESLDVSSGAKYILNNRAGKTMIMYRGVLSLQVNLSRDVRAANAVITTLLMALILILCICRTFFLCF